MAKYLVELGHAPRLAYAELVSFLTQRRLKFSSNRIRANLVRLSTNHAIECGVMNKTLGGTVRVAEWIWQTDQDRLVAKIAKRLMAGGKRVDFGLACLGGGVPVREYSRAVKRALAAEGRSSRFLEGEGQFLAPLTVVRERAVELVLVVTGKEVHVYETKSVSQTEEWLKRDRMRPEVDAKIGVLPPKTARMMVNLALSKPASSEVKLVDPFCGSGTILTEAATLGLHVYGSDIDPKAIERSRKNLEWLKASGESQFEYRLQVAHATKLEPSMFGGPVDAIVSEADLGPTDRNKEGLEETIRELFGLYETALQSWLQVLKPKGRVVLAMARHPHPLSVKMTEKLIDSCEKSGYTFNLGPVLYSRPGAFVKRAIVVLVKR